MPLMGPHAPSTGTPPAELGRVPAGVPEQPRAARSSQDPVHRCESQYEPRRNGPATAWGRVPAGVITGRSCQATKRCVATPSITRSSASASDGVARPPVPVGRVPLSLAVSPSTPEDPSGSFPPTGRPAPPEERQEPSARTDASDRAAQRPRRWRAAPRRAGRPRPRALQAPTADRGQPLSAPRLGQSSRTSTIWRAASERP